MTVIVRHVAVIYMGLRQPKKYCKIVILSIDFKYCVEAINKCHPFHVFSRNMCSRPSPLHLVIIIGPFTNWVVDFMDLNLTSAGGNHHIIVTVDYFTKWVEAMPTIKFNGDIARHFVFNQIIAQFGILKEVVIDHGSHF
jgi:hypothetical protein